MAASPIGRIADLAVKVSGTDGMQEECARETGLNSGTWFRNRRRNHATSVWLVTLVLCLTGCDLSRGKSAVAEMCAKDGGLRISATVFTAGYLLDDDQEIDCGACVEQLAKTSFDYVDFHNRRSDYTRLFEGAGYYRFSVSSIGDPRCTLYSEEVRRHLVLNAWRYGLKASQCIAIERLPERPSGYVYSQGFRRTQANNGQALGVIEQFIREEPSGTTLATNRNYLFTSRMTRWLDMGGGGGKTDAMCADAEHWRIHRLDMIAKVLRDESKQSRRDQ